MKRLTDEELVARVLSGEQEAFSLIVERYQNQIFSLAFRLGGDYDEARDMAQDAFLRIYQELRSFDPSRRFFPWMYRVAHNTCINALHKKPKPMADIDEIADFTPAEEGLGSPEHNFEQKEQARLLREALAELPDQFREPIFLKYMEGLSYKEIAERLDLPVSTIETRLYRGRQMLQKLLQKSLHR